MKHLLLISALATAALAQERVIPGGTSIPIRTNETVDARSTDGRVFSGIVDQDVIDNNGRVAIPRGANAELMVRRSSNRDLVLDLEAIDVHGTRYTVSAEADRLVREGKDGIGENRRTGEYVGGGALLGTIIGAVAGGGRGAAIGALSGAAAGGGAQVLTRGRSVRVPAESILTFRLERPLEVGPRDNGYMRDGHHYHPDDRRPDDRRDDNRDDSRPRQ